MINKKNLIAAVLLMVGIAQATHANVVVINLTSSTLQVTGLYDSPSHAVNIVAEYVGPNDSITFYPRPDNKLTFLSVCLNTGDKTTCDMSDFLKGVRVGILKETKVIIIKTMNDIIQY